MQQEEARFHVVSLVSALDLQVQLPHIFCVNLFLTLLSFPWSLGGTLPVH